jgi:endonuclease YncB( thermonuclease family)
VLYDGQEDFSFYGEDMIWLMIACGPKAPEAPSVSEAPTPAEPTVILDGVSIAVEWDDGDTFHGKTADGTKIKARLAGYNTLESYGPVHQWGEWTEKELYAFAKESGVFASKTVWECTDTKKGGGYGRVLVDCPELRRAMLENGFAHPFSVGGPAPEADLKAMKTGMDNKAGIWAKGTPKTVITSLHSQDEKPDKEVYNRICDLTTGECGESVHTDVYETCQKVCIEDTCMTYVPYKVRYGDNRAECLK